MPSPKASPLVGGRVSGRPSAVKSSECWDFGALQDDLANGGSGRIIYFAFDLLYLDGYDLRRSTLIERKRLLAELVGDQRRRLRPSGHQEGGAAAMFKRACQIGIEGIVSKRAAPPLLQGRQGRPLARALPPIVGGAVCGFQRDALALCLRTRLAPDFAIAS